jgi:hypothetical protein
MILDKLNSYLSKINEGKQVGQVYHYTTPGRALGILRDNEIKSGNYGPGPDLDKKGVSLTRDKNFHKQNRIIHGTHVRFVLHGDSISNNNKIHPYHGTIGMHNDEQEEFVHGNIKNAKKHIKEIHIMATHPERHSDFYKEHYKELQQIAKEKNIPIKEIS